MIFAWLLFFMPWLNVEIKAKCADPDFIRQYLITHKAEFKGIDQQTDTYFQVPSGRLKLREGNIENSLIYYNRDNKPGPKNSDFYLFKLTDTAGIKELLTRACGVKMIVTKKREIYYLGNVKFHIDEVPGLGNFTEIEAGNVHADKTETELRQQCDFYISELGVKQTDMIADSYSDMMADLQNAI